MSGRTATERALSTAHRKVLEQCSAIAPEVIAERRYWTANDWTELDGLGFKGLQKAREHFPALVIPQNDPTGEYTYSVLRYDRPRIRQNGDSIKYEQPAGQGLRLDVPHRCISGLRDAALTLWWTEGAKKADALASLGLIAVSTPGVDGWQSPHALPDLIGIPLRERTVVLAYDSDVLTKPTVHRAVVVLAGWMQQKGAHVEVLDWSRR